MVWFALHGAVPQTVNRAPHGTVCQKEYRVFSLVVFPGMTMICQPLRAPGMILGIAKLDVDSFNTGIKSMAE